MYEVQSIEEFAYGRYRTYKGMTVPAEATDDEADAFIADYIDWVMSTQQEPEELVQPE